MSLKEIFKSALDESFVIKRLDKYLVSLSDKDGDRAIDVNAPSQAGTCLRSRFYTRKGYDFDDHIDARLRRIFGNGIFTHERLQGYLKEEGMLLCDELPMHNIKYNIQGHTDGLLDFGKEKAILEIKSINLRGFNDLKMVKPEHKKQGLVYLYCVEQRRLELHREYEDFEDFENHFYSRNKFYKSLYNHLKDGNKYKRREKIAYQVHLHSVLDEILMRTDKPITKVIFLYENKDTQDLKEFCVSSTEKDARNILETVLREYEALNNHCLKDNIPPREGKSKNDNVCRWCNYKLECWC